MVFDTQLRIIYCNPAYLRTVGRESADQIVGKYVFDAFPADPESASYRLLKDSLDRVLATKEQDVIALIPYDTGTNKIRYWSATHTPVPGTSGDVEYILQHTVDVTELQELRASASRNISEAGVLQRAARVQATNQQLSGEVDLVRALLRQAPGFVAVLSGPAHKFEIANEAYERLVGRTELVGKSLAEALPEIVDQGFLGLLDEVVRTGEPYLGRGVLVRLAREEGEPARDFYLDFVYQPIKDNSGQVSGVFVQGHDITEQKRIERQLQAIARESSHRIKNLLTLVSAIAKRTFAGGVTLEEAKSVFEQRLRAMAGAQQILDTTRAPTADIRALVTDATSLFADAYGNRIQIDGPAIEIDDRSSVGLALAVHELVTNAIKYGALSNEAGSVLIHWDVDDGALIRWTWEERGGPPVVAPQKRGYGSTLIERSLPPVGEPAHIIYDEDGLRFTVTLLSANANK